MATALGIILLLLIGILSLHAQMPPTVQVKISDMPFQVSNAQHLNQIVWTMLGPTTKETIYCVSESPVSQLRFVCIDCIDRNITDMVNVLNSAQDLTRSAGFPTIVLRNIVVNTNWTGATIMCQATLQGQIVDSAPATVDVRYLKQPHVVDENGQGPVLISNQGYRFYVECVRGPDNLCQQSGRRKTLRCAVQAHPDANNFRWLKNGVITSGNGAEITIGTEMIGQSIQCQANNNLLSDQEMQTSEAVQIDPYSSAHLSGDNFAQLQSIPPFQAGNRIEMNQQVKMTCNVDGNPRPVVFWRLRRSNGQVEDAACPQGFEGQYTEMGGGLGLPYRNPNAVVRIETSSFSITNSFQHLTASCTLKIQNYSYSGQYWCSACSYVSQGAPECSPPLDSPGQSTLNIQVIGTPMQSDTPTTIEQVRDPPDSRHNSAVVTVHYCAEPMPRPPREVVFIIDQNDLQVGQQWENFQFEGATQNNSVPNCYLARLKINQVRDSDRYRQISLKVMNQYGSKQIPVSLDTLLGGGSSSSAHINAWWIVFFVVIGLILFSICLLAFCIKRRVMCFQRTKDATDYNEPKAKANLNARDNFYDADPPRHFNPTPTGEVNEPAYGVYLSREAVV
ncbi:hypothetical protein WR25_04048 isoform R [Diploscapter pachys]|uniref:Ig-like domain-containing protein n=1 Tax=Diploscapter pachys TaxID=2018661 RepID=A0A2A2KM10_9BILA|nr:hypothetical protein WR25_04048 isoform R [Diploscapter pachys]